MNEKIEEIKNKSINSKKIVGTLSKVSIIGIKRDFEVIKNFISSKIFKKLRHKNKTYY